MKNLVTIIVPVYQAEMYIRCCIESILSQHYMNWELLLINDGSTDKSGLICDEYAIVDSRIHVYHQLNKGVSTARNKGLKVAKGDFLLFVDADDYLKDDALDTLVNIATTNNLSILQFGIKSYQNETEISSIKQKAFKLHIYEDLNKYHSFQYGVWGYLIHKNIYKNEAFTEGVRYAEDIEYISKCIAISERIGVLSAKFYYLRLHPQSAMANLCSYNQAADHIIVIRNLSNYKLNKNINYSFFINHQITKLVKSYFSFFIKNNIAKEDIKQINQDYRSIYPLICTDSLKEKISFMIAYLDIRIYVALLRLYVSKTLN